MDEIHRKAKCEIAKRSRQKNVDRNNARLAELKSEEYCRIPRTCTRCKVERIMGEFRSELGKPDGYSTQCSFCLNEIERHRYHTNPAVKEYDKNYQRNKPEIYRKASLVYFYMNKESQKIQAKKWRDANRGPRQARRRLRIEWVSRATPSWVDPKEIEEIYAYAQMWTVLTGEQQSVDHIIPLRGESVCGLHTPANLRIMPLLTNISKKNEFDPSTFIGP